MQDKKTVNSKENKNQNKTNKQKKTLSTYNPTAFKNEGKIKMYSDIRTLKGLISTGPVL